MEKKLFRNCPHSDLPSCTQCHNYFLCMDKKKQRRAKRERERRIAIAKLLVKSVAVLTVLIVAGALIVHTANAKQNEQEEKEVIVWVSDSKESGSNTELVGPQGFLTEILEKAQENANPEYVYDATKEERVALTKLVIAEAEGEPFEGQVAVAAVVLNRYFSDDPFFENDSIISIIQQKSQFADINKISQERLEKNESCAMAVEMALRGKDPTKVYFPEGATFFYAPKHIAGHEKEIREGIDYYQIGNHNFHVDFEKF